NALADAQEAHTRANHDLLQSEEAANAALSRTRYALYDVSQAMQAVGIAGIAVTAAIAGSAVAYEAEFANVRRTVGVTGEAADDLYDSMIRMSTTIPTSFADLGQIGTLAGQLGVAEGRVASFTRTTAQFSATTDVTVDAAATAFGRLDTLLADVQGQYDRLGSSILNVGINSVATESEIVAISNQIAAAAQQSNLAASEVVGLSAALASLGVRPEAARGSILRVFSNINTAISEGGEALEEYGRLAGMSAEQFRQGWSSDFTGTFTAWLEGVQSSGKGAEQTLRDLGITAVRDLNALLRLAQNGDVLRESLDLAAEGFDNTSILAENFGVISTTNAAKIQILGNGLLGFFATLGQGTSGPLSDFLDKLIDVTQTLIRFADNPYVQTAGLIVTATAAIVGILGIVGGLVLRGVGSWIALRQAIGSTTAQTWLAAGGFRAMAAQMIGAEGAARGFGAALKATGLGLLITGGLWLLGEAVGAIASEMRTGKQVAEDYFGTIDGLTAAMVADDPTIVASAIRKQGSAAREAAVGFDEMVLSIAAQRAETERMQAAIAAGNEAIASQTFTIGENTRAWIENSLLQSEAFTRMFENASQLQALMGTTFTGGGVTVTHDAFSMETMIQRAAEGGSEAAVAYVDEWYAGLARAFEQGGAGSADLAIFEALGGNEALTQVREMAEATGAAVEEGLAMSAAGDAAAYLTDQLLGTADAGYEMGEGMDYAAASAWNSSDAINQIISDAYGADNAARALADSVFNLGVEFANNGARAAVSSDAMQQVIQNILTSSGSAGQAAANLHGF
ncbi:MAG TPA: phage tail tape measure protein, partial [Agrococcus sp.]|nr:phage tail tape measure protein [Agrococcus sp.]